MNDLNVIAQQNEDAKNQALINKLKADGYKVYVQRQAGLNSIAQVYAFHTTEEARTGLIGKEGVEQV